MFYVLFARNKLYLSICDENPEVYAYDDIDLFVYVMQNNQKELANFLVSAINLRQQTVYR